LATRSSNAGPLTSCAIAAALLIATGTGAAPPPTSATPNFAPRGLPLEFKSTTGDLDSMIAHRVIRLLVPHSRTLFYTDKGHERGLSVELARDFERYVNRKYAKSLGRRPLTVTIVPTARDELLSGLIEGRGDMAVGNLTVTAARRAIVDFVVLEDRPPVREVLVTGPSSAVIHTLDGLSGKALSLRPTSSYFESVTRLNERLAASGRVAVEIDSLPEALEDEDVLEMLNAGVVDYAVVDDWKALLWAKVLPKIKVRQDLVLREEGHIGWAIRKESPKLRSVVASFYETHVERQGLIETRFAQLQRNIKQIADNTRGTARARFERTVELFRKYGEKYDFDPLMLTAQGFQESKLDQNARSHAGAIGIMQILPATGKDMRVGDIHKLEPNIHAGVKYMDHLMKGYFADAHFSAGNRSLFALASYNAGPGNIAKMRRIAAKRGLDPNVWFYNVEIVTASQIGLETTTYVRNIYKYYISYKLIVKIAEARRQAREAYEAMGDSIR
jgi:membrane-bound lytic murein transglycosylase MltF